MGALSIAILPALQFHGASAALPPGGTFHALTPSRILDTRPGAPLGAGAVLPVVISGQGGVPSSGVSAVVLNVTATNTSATSYLTLFPAGGTLPLASNLNWSSGQTVAKLVTVGLGGTDVSAFNAKGSVDIIFDVAGYYSTPVNSPGPDGLFNPLVPARLLDTRTMNPGPIAKLNPGQTLDLQVTGRGNVPSTGASAVVLNVTATNPTTSGYLTVFPEGLPTPTASNLNFRAGETVPNRVMVGLGATGQVSIYNAAGTTNVIVDVNGWFTDSTVGGTGSWFNPLTPARILDSRSGLGGFVTQWGPDSGRAVGVAGLGGVPLMTDPNPPTAVIANLTVTNTSAPSALVAWPDGAAQPTTSDVNWPRGGTVPNPVIVQVGASGKVDLYNIAGCTDVIMDVVGWFTGPTPTITAGPPPTETPCPLSVGWLGRFNMYRATAGVPFVTENSVWSDGDYLHSRWMVKNNLASHDETPGTPYYTTAGDTAGNSGNISVSSTTSSTDNSAIDWWMAAPFHAMAMMDPRLTTTGFGAYRENFATFRWEAGWTLDTTRGNPFTGVGAGFPVMWPGNGKTVPLRTYSGSESPNPLQACPAQYSSASSVGLPVFIEVGGNVATTATLDTFTGNGAPLAHCVIDSQTSITSLRPYLTYRGGVIIIPLAPLQPGVTYAVAVTVNGTPRAWTFSVS